MDTGKDALELIGIFSEGQSIESFCLSDFHKLVLNIYPLVMDRMLLI